MLLNQTLVTICFVDPPEVRTHKVSLIRKSSLFLELACWVNCNPPCESRWLRTNEREEMVIISMKNKSDVSLEMRGVYKDVPVVVIKNPEESHIGSYMCTATNSLGESHQMVELKGNV